MIALDSNYHASLKEILDGIQNSEELAAYLENEESDDYNALRDKFEPVLAELYLEVATERPLQIPALEEALLNDHLEGLFLPKILGYNVLRGPISSQYIYYYPQESFRKTLLTICNSSNFEELKKRIGQTIQIGFALSSNIWVSNLIAEVDNKFVRQYLQSLVFSKYYQKEVRKEAYDRYALQFKNDVFFTASFPKTLAELRLNFPALRNFIGNRVLKSLDNSTLMDPMYTLLNNESLQGSKEYLYLLVMFLNFFDPTTESKKKVGSIFNGLRKNDPEFPETYFGVLIDLHHGKYNIAPECDRRVTPVVDMKIKDSIAGFYTLTESIHTKGYVNPEVIDLVGVFYGEHPGVSHVNECVRLTILNYLTRFLQNIDPSAYPDFMEISKTYVAYMRIFDNEPFNLEIKALSLAYVKKLIKKFTDKRGKDYQDIKRFVSASFIDHGFLNEKEIVELFKTRRKKNTETA